MKRLLFKLLLAIIPTLFSIYLLIKLFPYTGLGRIVSVPATVIINLGILIICIKVIDEIKSKGIKGVTWILAIATTILISIIVHPQEFLPSVLTQIIRMIF